MKKTGTKYKSVQGDYEATVYFDVVDGKKVFERIKLRGVSQSYWSLDDIKFIHQALGEVIDLVNNKPVAER